MGLMQLRKNLNVTKLWLTVGLCCSLLLGGCSGITSNNKARGILRRGVGQGHATDSFAFYGEEITPEREEALLTENTIYFGYDKDEIVDRYKLVVLAHAKKLLDDPNLKLRVDGHTDERGSSEYNIGLGERRAKAVVRFIQLKGIKSDRLIAVSYGKEKPVAIDHNEEAWRLNRRAELVFEEGK